MEITEKTLKDRLNQIILLQDDDQKWAEIKEKIREKGVECSIIVPILDVFLGYDGINDIAYEEPSKKVNGQRFDFLILDKIIVEAKRLEENLNDHITQISTYMYDNELEFGILTNGFDYWFLLSKQYIQRIANEGQEITNLNQKVLPVLKLSIDPLEEKNCESFLKIIKMFSKDIFDDTLKKIANVACKIITFSKKGKLVLHKEKAIDEYLQKNINETIDYDKGSYFDELQNGTLKEGQELIYEDGILAITVLVQKNGLVKYPCKGLGIKDFSKMRETKEYEPLLELLSNKWDYQEAVYKDYKDIFRKITGKKSIYSKYRFVPK
ncbi:MAG: hypothetical protein LBU17_07135 [Treponema sp.]|nr:hypothetical protein [Treponema sp.]